MLAEHPGPAVLVGVDTPQLGAAARRRRARRPAPTGSTSRSARAADGGYYLIGLREPHDEVFALPAADWGGPERDAADDGGGGRRRPDASACSAPSATSTSEADARALLADPLTPAEIVAALRPPG